MVLGAPEEVLRQGLEDFVGQVPQVREHDQDNHDLRRASSKGLGQNDDLAVIVEGHRVLELRHRLP